MGRPALLLLNPTLGEEIAKHVELGMSFKRAAIACGVSDRVFHMWEKRGAADVERRRETPYSLFFQRLQRARAVSEKLWLANLVQAATPDTERVLAGVKRILVEIVATGAPVNMTGVARAITQSLHQSRRDRPDWRAFAFLLGSRFPEEYAAGKIQSPKQREEEAAPVIVNIPRIEPSEVASLDEARASKAR